MEKLNVFILTEGSSNIGFGHITRMLSIYQAFEEKGIKPTFIINGDDTVKDLIKDTDYKIYNWIKDNERLITEIKDADIAIIDSYLAPKELYKEIAKSVNCAVYYDDYNRIQYPKGIVINGNIHAKSLNYPQIKGVKYLLGTKYLPLRKEFWDVPEKKIKESVSSIMITFGGDDLRNMTPKILKALKENYPDIIKNVIIGKGFKNVKEIEKETDNNTNLIYYPNAQKMKEVMLESDIAISAGGQTLYELARTGTPAIAVLVADNQMGNIEGLEKAGFIEFAGNWDNKNMLNQVLKKIEKLKKYNLRLEKSKIGKYLVDGKGSIRIVKSLETR